MKFVCRLLMFVPILCLSVSSGAAQVTNFVVNGSSSNFTFTSGDAVSWSYNLPTGATASGELWYDVNQNGVIDPSTDVTRFIFTQTDGDPNGSGGPPDMDGSVNGSISFSQPVGLAPGKYIFRMTHNSVGLTVAGTVTPLSSPAHLISGHVTPPAGKSAQYIFVNMNSNSEGGGGDKFWDAITDASGNYTIQMNADTSGNPWRIRIESNPFPPSIISPDLIELTITGNHSGNNFAFLQAAAQVAGVIRDENGNPLPEFGLSLWRNDGNVQHNGSTNASGFFQIGLEASELTSETWNLQTDCFCQQGGGTGSILITQVQLPVINANDSLYRSLTIYSVNSQIQGQLRLNGSAPSFSMQIMASSADTAFAQSFTDSGTGYFTIGVSDKIQNYSFTFGGLPFGWEVQQTVAHPGDTGVIVNIVTQTNVMINTADSWNMLSVPVKVTDNQKTTLFPLAISPAFSYTGVGGYQQQTNLFNGIGYWMKFSGTNSSPINGTYILQETVAVAAGWNLIGSITDSILASTIEANGTTMLGNPFGYGSTGYFATSTIKAGNAYWIKVSGAGQLILKQSSAGTPRIETQARSDVPSMRRLEGFNQLIAADAGGNKRILYFTSRNDVGLETYELPPAPPAGIMDMRFSSNRLVEGPDGGIEKAIALLISSAEYPLAISWKINEGRSSARLLIDGKDVVLERDGTRSITHSGSGIELKIPSPENDLPMEFGLSQNYPNPFNPATEIHYQVAEPRFVSLKIYNIMGQEISALVQEEQQPGWYSATWDASAYPSGVYYYRMTAGEFSATRKLLLMK